MVFLQGVVVSCDSSRVFVRHQFWRPTSVFARLRKWMVESGISITNTTWNIPEQSPGDCFQNNLTSAQINEACFQSPWHHYIRERPYSHIDGKTSQQQYEKYIIYCNSSLGALFKEGLVSRHISAYAWLRQKLAQGFAIQAYGQVVRVTAILEDRHLTLYNIAREE